MNNKHLYILLDIIFRNGSVKRLTRDGVDYNEIPYQIEKAVNDKLISYSEEKIILTDKGVQLLKELDKIYKRTNKEDWIEKDEKNQVAKIDKNSIFVPRQNELTFLVLS